MDAEVAHRCAWPSGLGIFPLERMPK
jgi:hypothetical protein